MSDIRKMMNLFEARQDDENVTYEEKTKAGQVEKITAFLSKNKSREFTMLGKKIAEANELSNRVKLLEKEIKGEARDAISDMFDVEDECATRILETASFTLQLSKKPEPTTTVKYASVLAELKDHLTPELIVILKGLEKKFSTVTQKEAALKTTSKTNKPSKVTEATEDESYYDELEDFSERYSKAALAKLDILGRKLDNLKAEVK